jgi:hypothetical protein
MIREAALNQPMASLIRKDPQVVGPREEALTAPAIQVS